MACARANWTGCYVGGGGGYGLWNQENSAALDARWPARAFRSPKLYSGWPRLLRHRPGRLRLSVRASASSQFVVGAFGDYDFAGMQGPAQPAGFRTGVGSVKRLLRTGRSAAASAALVTPSLLTYFSAVTPKRSSTGSDYTNLVRCSLRHSDGSLSPIAPTYKGWFIGAGDEYALSFLPGLFWKTEYRFSLNSTRQNQLDLLRRHRRSHRRFATTTKKCVHSVRIASWSTASTGVARSSRSTDLC